MHPCTHASLAHPQRVGALALYERTLFSLLGAALAQVKVVEFGPLGHMGPVTHPDVLNPVIARFLQRCIGQEC